MPPRRFLKIYLKAVSLLVMLICFGLNEVVAQDDNTIELLEADVTEFDQEFLNAERVKGNVRFKHKNTFMDCDSAYFYREQNRIEAFGSIYIRQRDTLDLWGDYLEYDGDEENALVKDNVRLKDNTMELETDVLRYDLKDKIAYYTTGGKIKNGQDRLYSRVGQYFSRSQTFGFKDSVVLVNPQYSMNSDTLRYNTNTKTAFFYGPTYIYSEENTIYCNYGWYDTENNTSQFSKGAWIKGKENQLWADSMLYNRNTGIGHAYRDIRLVDSVEQIEIRGGYGKYNRFAKQTMVSINPLAIKYFDDDSLYLKADTLVDLTDTSNGNRILNAFRNTILHKSDMQGSSDSLVYNFTDSTIHMFYDPVLWTEDNQITGDTLVIYRKNGELEHMDVMSNAFIAGKVDDRNFDQIGGRDMKAKFQASALKTILVFGNGRSLYYAEEDSNTYTGVNHIVCSDMRIELDSNTVQDITFYDQPEGTFYPVNEVPSDLKRLQGFIWLEESRPVLEHFIGAKEYKKTSRERKPNKQAAKDEFEAESDSNPTDESIDHDDHDHPKDKTKEKIKRIRKR